MNACKFNKGEQVFIQKIGQSQTVHSSKWDGAEYVYTLRNKDGALDEGWLEAELRKYNDEDDVRFTDIQNYHRVRDDPATTRLMIMDWTLPWDTIVEIQQALGPGWLCVGSRMGVTGSRYERVVVTCAEKMRKTWDGTDFFSDWLGRILTLVTGYSDPDRYQRVVFTDGFDLRAYHKEQGVTPVTDPNDYRSLINNLQQQVSDLKTELEDATQGPGTKFFEFAHLPERLQAVSGEFYALACSMDALLDDSPQKALGMQRLIEAKDCMVRARISQGD